MKPNIGALKSVRVHASKFWVSVKGHVVSFPHEVRGHFHELFHGAETPKERAQRTIKHGLLLLAQLSLVLGVYAAGCALASVLPITLPGNIIGMVLLLILLGTHVLKTKYVSEACDYLIDNMSIFFIPAGVAIMGCFSLLEGAAAKFALVCITTTVLVFLATSYTVLLVSKIMAKAAEHKAAKSAEGENDSVTAAIPPIKHVKKA